jgi:methylenetetrahydrofolate reductase (NADPH)
VLRAKQDAGAAFAISQFFFRVDDRFRLRDRAAAAGVTIPIIPGLMPVTDVRQIQRFAQLSGAALPADLVARLVAVQDDPEAVRAVGVEHAAAMAGDLLVGGAPGLHFYTLNRSSATREIYQRLGLAHAPRRREG